MQRSLSFRAAATPPDPTGREPTPSIRFATADRRALYLEARRADAASSPLAALKSDPEINRQPVPALLHQWRDRFDGGFGYRGKLGRALANGVGVREFALPAVSVRARVR